MALQAGMRLAGVLLQDRETGKHYALHDECAHKLSDMLGADVYQARMVPMGPVTSGSECNLATCGRPVVAGE